MGTAKKKNRVKKIQQGGYQTLGTSIHVHAMTCAGQPLYGYSAPELDGYSAPGDVLPSPHHACNTTKEVTESDTIQRPMSRTSTAPFTSCLCECHAQALHLSNHAHVNVTHKHLHLSNHAHVQSAIARGIASAAAGTSMQRGLPSRLETHA